jgi:hypothetical protein
MSDKLFSFGSKIANEIHKLIHDSKYGRQVCSCGQDLTGCEIDGYVHAEGWDVKRLDGHMTRYWLYITCPKCKNQWAIWKLGVSRDQTFEEA